MPPKQKSRPKLLSKQNADREEEEDFLLVRILLRDMEVVENLEPPLLQVEIGAIHEEIGDFGDSLQGEKIR